MKPVISEFSYGYALTEELVSSLGRGLSAAPVFPSLYEEGKTGGYDVKIPSHGYPLFIQFKLSHKMIRDTAIEVKHGVLTNPFYRMHIRSRKHSRQHEMLLELESKGNLVYYTAPCFHSSARFNQAYLARNIINESFWIRPSLIGKILDDNSHHVAFKDTGPAYLCSTPRLLETNDSAEVFKEQIQTEAFEPITLDRINQLAEEIESIIFYNIPENIEGLSRERELLLDRHPLERVAYYARVYFGAQLHMVNKQ